MRTGNGDMTPDGGLAAFDTAVTSVKLLLWIIKTTQEVVRFKATCQKIGQLATTLMGVLEKNKATLENQRTSKDLNKLLQDLGKFLVRCTLDSNFIQLTWEVIWTKKLPKMLGELESRTLYLILETTVRCYLNTVSRNYVPCADEAVQAETRTAVAGQAALENNIATAVNTIETKTQQLLENDVQNAKRSDFTSLMAVIDARDRAIATKMLGVEVSFRVDDGRFQVLASISDHPPRLSATLDGTRVICIPSLTGTKHHSSRLPRLIRIYLKISALTLVQPFYGIAETSDTRARHWAVMQDLSPYQALGQAIQAKTLPNNIFARLKIAYELSKTVAYLHSVNIVIKCMTDASIILRPVGNDGGTDFEPVLTNLDESREVSSHSRSEYDNTEAHVSDSFFNKLPGRLTTYDTRLLSTL